MRLAVSLVLWASLLTGATLVAIRRPAVAIRLAKGVLALLAAVWALTCGLGIASVVQRGRGGQGSCERRPFSTRRTSP